MNRTNSCLDWVLSLWAHFSVLRFIFVYVLFCVWLYCMHVYYCNMVRWTWWDWSLILRTITSFSAFWHCWLGHVKPVPDMTYNVFSGTLNPTQSIKVMESRTDRLHVLYYWTVFSQHLDFLFLVSSLLFFCLVSYHRLSWLFVNFLAHLNIVHCITYRTFHQYNWLRLWLLFETELVPVIRLLLEVLWTYFMSLFTTVHADITETSKLS